jgi:hypothetical protein
MWWGACRVSSEWLWVRRRVEGDMELACPLAMDVGRPLPDTLFLADRNITHPF